jgi:tRNA pseudouridine55 synthase
MHAGIHLMHKPVGPTSFSVVRDCIAAASSVPRQGKPKVCHGGTLDPFASGLLLLLVGQATKLFDYLHAIPKVYDSIIRWGLETDNGDLLGQPTFTGDPSGLSPGQLDEALARFLGWQDQVPPSTSAKRIGGERAYEKVHRGEMVVLPPCRVYLHEARWIGHNLPHESRLRVTVRGGYYVRALARDLGQALGCGAHLTALHRSAIGPWNDPGPGKAIELHGREILPWAQARILSDQEVGELRQGRTVPLAPLLEADWPLPPGFPPADAPIRGFHLDKLSFLLQAEAGRLRMLNEFRGGL